MNVVSIESLSKSYGEKTLFENLTFGIEEGEKIGLIGVNGTGKSTLLAIIAGIEFADQGRVAVGSAMSLRYLSQNPSFQGEAAVIEQVFQGDLPVMSIVRDYKHTLELLNLAPNDEDLRNRLAGLSQQMDTHNGWLLETEAKIILTKLGITNYDDRVGTLSGGQRKRVALANALINPVDLLILDEPTNHIDNETVNWLEQYLNKRAGALLMVTHDRYFLDRVVNRMVELDQGKLYSYSGNYTQFLELKMEREERQSASELKRMNLFRNELAWIRRGAKARTTKQKARIDRFGQLEEGKPELYSDKIDISVGSSRLGKKVIELEHIDKAFTGEKLLQDFNYIVVRDDRIGIIGPNGSGKSTLLHIIAGRLQPDKGTVIYGQTVKLGCFFQENETMDERLRVIEYIKEEAQVIQTSDGSVITAAQMLERFLFPSPMQWTPIAKLSGGERRRLYLLRVLMSAPNVLLLDEPTNDLDIQTLTILEDYLDYFQGAVIVVSHDRYFLDRVTERIFAFEGNGQVAQHVGNYSDYQSFILKRPDVVEEAGRNSRGIAIARDAEEAAKKDRPIKFSFREQREYEQIDELIANAEKELKEVNGQMAKAGSDSVRLQQLLEAQQQLEDKLDALLERWTYLNELAEEIAKAKS